MISLAFSIDGRPIITALSLLIDGEVICTHNNRVIDRVGESTIPGQRIRASPFIAMVSLVRMIFTMDEINWQAALQRCLESTHYCALSTVGTAGAWSNPVFFSYGDRLTLLFISRPSSLHMKNIDHDQNVAVSIFSTDQPPGEHVISIQMTAVAEKLVGDAVTLACEQYFARPGAKIAISEEQPDPRNYLGANDQWQFVRLTPTGVWLFDTEHFGEERVGVPDHLWRQK